jgi:two-component system, OmpR family, KDP operon response regulator KdpE
MEAISSQKQVSVLVVDDDPTFRQGLRASLKTRGYFAYTAANGEEALQKVRQQPIDVVLLDVNMPGVGGIEACRRIRAASPQSGIVMLTVRDAKEDKIIGLEAGADDYLTKPFHFGELLARLRAILRRIGPEVPPQTPVLRAGELELELESRRLRKAGREIHLSPKEFDLLAVLMEHKNLPVTHAKMLRTVWGPEYGDEPEYLRTYIKALRKKIEADPSHPEYILTEPWFGYRFRDPAEPGGGALSPAAQDEDDLQQSF